MNDQTKQKQNQNIGADPIQTKGGSGGRKKRDFSHLQHVW